MNKKLASLLLVAALAITGCQSATTTSKKEVKTNDTKVTTSAKEEKKSFEGKYITSAEYVKNNINNDKVIFVDARGMKEASKTGTVLNAVIMTWQDIADVADKKPGEKGWGHMMEKSVLSKKLGELGLDMNKEIVLFSNANAGWGEDGRILWELKACGYKNLKMVDGGINAIKKVGVTLDNKATKATPVKVEIKEIDYANTINTDELTKDFAKYKIVDSREKDEYEGATKFGEAKGGHIKGAKNIPYSSLYNEEGMLKSKDELKKLFSDKELKESDEVVTYCTGGIRSAFMQLIMEELGYNKVKNYEGSYYNWAAVNEVER